MAKHQDSFSQKNSELAIIGSGAYTNIVEFKKITGYSGILLTDPSRKSYELLGFSSNIGGLFGMKTLAKGFSALRQGVMPGLLQGGALQLGGSIILDQDGSVRYHFQSNEAGEDVPVEEMLGTLV